MGLKVWIGWIWCVKDIIRVSPRLEVRAVFMKPARRFVSKTGRCRCLSVGRDKLWVRTKLAHTGRDLPPLWAYFGRFFPPMI